MKPIVVLLFMLTSVAVAADQVPFVVTFTSSVPGGALPSCPAGQVPTALAGVGQATHLGQFTETQTHCTNLATGEFVSGVYSITGANGYIVFGTYSGHIVPTTATTGAIYGIFKLTGGTGRFANATGGGAATGTLDFVTGEANDLLLKGTISRPGK
jgi:hypothetical protein